MSRMPIVSEPPLSVTEFLDELQVGSIERTTIQNMLEFGQSLLLRPDENGGGGPPPPQIRVVQDATLQAESMDGLIYVNRGLIEYYSKLKAPPVSEAFKDIVDPFLPLYLAQDFLIRNFSFGWMLLHEHYHSIRMHSAVLKAIELEPGTLKAIESDADQCALARIYRSMQHNMRSFIPDETIKKLAFFYIFWGFRGLPDFSDQGTHPSALHRICIMLHKICHLRSNPRDSADPYASTEETKQAVVFMGPFFIACERSFCDANGVSYDPSEVIQFYENFGFRPMTTRWDEIRGIVGALSGTAS